MLSRRVVLVLLVAGAGSALWASPAMAGGVNTTTGTINGALYNGTPYRWTLVKAVNPEPCHNNENCWPQYPAQTIMPGGAGGWTLKPNLFNTSSPREANASWQIGYNGWFTYRVDVPTGPSFYATFTITQCFCRGDFGYEDPLPRLYFTTQAPPNNYNPGPTNGGPPPVPALAGNGGITWQYGVPSDWDLTFAPTGNFTIDASTAQGQAFTDLLNAICGQDSTSCSFTQVGPLTWGIGSPTNRRTVVNCTVGAASPTASSGVVQDDPPPPKPDELEADWHSIDYEVAQSASLSVGGSLTVGAEFNLFNTISGKISVKVEAEHEWTETKTFARGAKVYVPSNNVAQMWVAAVVGTVKGTLVAKIGSATFTAINFSETRSGVTKDNLTPAFNTITRTRPLTRKEYQDNCLQHSLMKAPASAGAKPPARLAPGRGVARVSLGQTQTQVLRQRGRPSLKIFKLNPCLGLEPGCYAGMQVGGRWAYRRLRVVFGPDLRVSGLIHTGSRLTSKAVGVGSSMTALRVAYPRASCTPLRYARRRYCTLQRAVAGGAVKTVFRLSKTRFGYKCDRVAIYRIPGARSGGV